MRPPCATERSSFSGSLLLDGRSRWRAAFTKLISAGSRAQRQHRAPPSPPSSFPSCSPSSSSQSAHASKPAPHRLVPLLRYQSMLAPSSASIRRFFCRLMLAPSHRPPVARVPSCAAPSLPACMPDFKRAAAPATCVGSSPPPMRAGRGARTAFHTRASPTAACIRLSAPRHLARASSALLLLWRRQAPHPPRPPRPLPLLLVSLPPGPSIRPPSLLPPSPESVWRRSHQQSWLGHQFMIDILGMKVSKKCSCRARKVRLLLWC